MNGKLTCLITLLAAAVIIFGCAEPVDNDTDTYQIGRSYSELESVWQYLNIYSIYQWDDSTRIPSDPFRYPSAQALMAAIGDGDYTMWNDLSYNAISGSINSSSSASSQKVVYLDTLTDSSVLVSIKTFESYDTYDQFAQLVPAMASFPFIIIDLRSNGGGFIDQATPMVNVFLKPGTSYLKTREREYDTASRTARTLDKDHYWISARTKLPSLADKKVTVVMDGGSASASEILIVALKEGLDATTLVGKKSYGKGIGQIKIPRRNRPTLKITFLQMRGINKIGDYHGKGILPDVMASDTEDVLLTAVKVNEPSCTSIRQIGLSKVSKSAEIGAYRVVHEQE